jgi:hypothetical protein
MSWDVPEGVRRAARRGLDLRRAGHRGGTAEGARTATALSSGAIGDALARKLVRWFQRFGGSQVADARRKPGWGSTTDPSPFYVAWLLWGGDSGAAWARRLRRDDELFPDG